MLKTLRLSLAFLLALLGVVFAARAQSDFRPGYIISLKGDTLHGSVDYGSGKRSTYECQFKAANATSADKYLPEQIQGYGFPHDRFYHSCQVPALKPAADTAAKELFVEVLVQGAASLYYVKDDNKGDHYYLQMGSGPLKPLVQLSEMVMIEGRKFRRDNPLFQKIFSDAFQACPAVRARTGELRLLSTSLVRICQQYNECVGGKQLVSEVAAPKRRSYFILEVVAGAQSSDLIFENLNTVQQQSFGGGAEPVVGLALQQYLPILANRFGVRMEVLYQRQQYRKEFFTPTNNNSSYQELLVHFDQLRIPLMIRYMPFNSSSFRPFAEVGASFGFALTNSSELRYRDTPTAPYSQWQPIFAKPRGVEESIMAGLGAAVLLPNKRHLTAELRAERTNGFSNAVGIGTYIHRTYFLLSYDLTKSH